MQKPDQFVQKPDQFVRPKWSRPAGIRDMAHHMTRATVHHMTNPYQEKAFDLPVTGPYRDFALEVRRIMGWTRGSDRPFLSTRGAAIKSDLSNFTISQMTAGYQVGRNRIRVFAQAFGEDADRLLKLAGYLSPEDVRLGVQRQEQFQSQSAMRIGSLVAEDHSRYGPLEEVPMSAFATIPFSEEMASAGTALPVSGSETDWQTMQSILPGGIHALRVRGDCMEPDYHNGDIILVRPTSQAANGQVVLARVNGEIASVKVFRQSDEGQLLESLAQPLHRITGDFEIMGVVEGFTRLHHPQNGNGH